MEQHFLSNSRFEILGANGFENFEGIIRNIGERPGVRLTTENRSVTSTKDHRFYISGKETLAENISVGDLLDTETGPEEVLFVESTVLNECYDIFNSDSHVILANGFLSHQCDEFAFVPPNKASEFWTSIQPVLSTGGSCIITSTPKSDEDQFAQIWKGANDRTDEYGNPTENNTGKNGFFAVEVTWDKHPERDEAWAKPFRESLGEARFRQEFECVVGETQVAIKFPDGSIRDMPIRDVYELLMPK